MGIWHHYLNDGAESPWWVCWGCKLKLADSVGSCCRPGETTTNWKKWDDKFLNKKVQQGRVQSPASGKEHVMNQHKLAKHLCREGPEGSAVYQVEHEPAKYPSDKDKWYLSYSRKSVSSNIQKLTGHCPGQLAVGGLTWADTFDQMTSWGPFPSQSFWDSMVLWYHFWKYTKILFISIT